MWNLVGSGQSSRSGGQTMAAGRTLQSRNSFLNFSLSSAGLYLEFKGYIWYEKRLIMAPFLFASQYRLWASSFIKMKENFFSFITAEKHKTLHHFITEAQSERRSEFVFEAFKPDLYGASFHVPFRRIICDLSFLLNKHHFSAWLSQTEKKTAKEIKPLTH